MKERETKRDGAKNEPYQNRMALNIVNKYDVTA